jgi:hypothetical protein
MPAKWGTKNSQAGRGEKKAPLTGPAVFIGKEGRRFSLARLPPQAFDGSYSTLPAREETGSYPQIFGCGGTARGCGFAQMRVYLYIARTEMSRSSISRLSVALTR